MENIGKFLVLFTGVVVGIIIRGFVISKMWLWLIVPLFHTPVLQFAQAAGLAVIAVYFTTKMDKSVNMDTFWESFAKVCIFEVLMASYALIAMWIISSGM